MSTSSKKLMEITSQAGLDQHLETTKTSKAVLLFGADWHEACPMLKMVLGALADTPDNAKIVFGNVDAESATDLSDRFEVTMVPTILLLSESLVKERLEGEVLSDPSHVTLAVQRLAKAEEKVPDSTDTAQDDTDTAPPHDPKQAALNDRLERLILADTVMLFMKGSPETPRCGFSRQAVELLRDEGIPFGSFDILSDNDVRQGLKTFSDWPTYPQIVSTSIRSSQTLHWEAALWICFLKKSACIMWRLGMLSKMAFAVGYFTNS